MQLEKLSRIDEVLVSLHRIDLRLRRCLHVNAWIDLHLDRLGRLAPIRERRDLVTSLNFVNRIVIRRTVSLSAANDPDVGSRRFDLRKSCRYRSAPASWRDEEIARLRSRRAPTRRRKYVRPHVEHRQQIVAPAGVRDRNDHRLLRQVQIGAGIQSVEVRAHDRFEIRWWERLHVNEHVHRAAEDPWTRGLIRKLLAGHVHGHERVEVDVGIRGNGLRLLLGDGALRPRGERKDGTKKKAHHQGDCASTQCRSTRSAPSAAPGRGRRRCCRCCRSRSACRRCRPNRVEAG